MDARSKLTVSVGIAMVLVGIAIYVTVPSMAAPLSGLVLAVVGAIIVVAVLARASSGRR